jgi:hypothetical protein
MSLTPFAPFLRALRDRVSHDPTSSFSGLREARLIAGRLFAEAIDRMDERGDGVRSGYILASG